MPQHMIRCSTVTAHEFMLWEALRLISPVGNSETDEIVAIAHLIDLAEDEVVDGLGSLLAKGLIRRVYNGEHDWFLALPDLSRPS